jgi:NADPH:quinone reductase-like Zn-dependent oxidoreductase
VTLTGNFVTAWHILTSDLEIKLPFPKPDDYTPPDADKPFFIWGAATSVGQYIVQLLKYYGFKHVVVTASRRHHEFLKNIGATSTFDYHDKTVVEDLRGALGAKPIYAIDCAGSAKGSIEPFAKVVPNGSTVDVMLPIVLEEPGEGRVPKLSMGGPDFVSWAKDVTVRTIVVGRYIEVRYHLYVSVI